jgi:hypothetical protein
MRRNLNLSILPYQTTYDAAAVNAERDFGFAGGMSTEDAAFTDAVRAVAIGRIRKEVRNNPYLAGLIEKLPEAIGTSSLRSRTGDREYDFAKETWWFRTSRKIGSLRQSLRTIEGIFWPEMAMCGEIFFIKLTDGRVQLVPSEFCGGMRFAVENTDGTREINGIGYDKNGLPSYYRFGRATIWGGISFTDGDSTIVPASKVIHVFKRDRVYMGRGLPAILPCITTARDLYEITRAKTKQIKDVTVFSGYVKKTERGTTGIAGLSGMRSYRDEENVPETSTDPADKQNEETQILRIAPGCIPEMDAGEEIVSLMSKYEAADYKDLIMLMLHAISTPLGLPVELWFSGLGDVNYSGFKGLGAQWASRRKEYIALEEELLLNPLLEWRTEYAHVIGELPSTTLDEDLVDWRWKRAAILDDDKQASAVAKRLASGESCIGDIWEENGSYADEELAKRRALYISGLRAAGDLGPEDDDAEVKVPLAFLFGNQIIAPTVNPEAQSIDEDEEKDNAESEQEDQS